MTADSGGVLYVVATPIGNLNDISARALNTLREVSYIYCENIRVTKKLLNRYDIGTPCRTFSPKSSMRVVQGALHTLDSGDDIALVSDAGTPTISDPGVRFVRAVLQSGNHSVITIPGPSALTAALSVSGAPASSFVFLGFLPKKKGRQSLFKGIAEEERTVVLYESPHRIVKTLYALEEHLEAQREVIVARELTKVYESLVRGTAREVREYVEINTQIQRGEFVVIISSLTADSRE